MSGDSADDRAVYVQVVRDAGRIGCGVMGRRQPRRPTDVRSALHHRLRRCWPSGRQTRRRTGWAIISSSFNTKSAERRNPERRSADATRRNKTVAICFTQKPSRYSVIISLHTAWARNRRFSDGITNCFILHHFQRV